MNKDTKDSKDKVKALEAAISQIEKLRQRGDNAPGSGG